jgi:hypothetical protein
MLDKNGDKPFDCVHEHPWVIYILRVKPRNKFPLLLIVRWSKLLHSGCENVKNIQHCSRITELPSFFFRVLGQWFATICNLGLLAPAPRTLANSFARCSDLFARVIYVKLIKKISLLVQSIGILPTVV